MSIAAGSRLRPVGEQHDEKKGRRFFLVPRTRSGLFRKTQDGPSATKWAVGEKSVAAVLARDFPYHCQAKPGAALFPIAPFLKAHEAPENALAVGRGNARAVVVDDDLDPCAAAFVLSLFA